MAALTLSFEAYKAELARRQHDAMMGEVARDADKVRRVCQKFSEFVKRAWHVIEPGTTLKWNWHLDAMCDHLEGISRGLMPPRLIINVPPGSSKSTIVSVLWQAWEWGPLGKSHLRYVTTSFDLANVKRDTGKTLDVIRSDWFHELWPEIELKTEGVQSFSNYDTGSRLGVAFKSVTGKRGDRLIVDDPHSVDGAESETQRDNTTRKFVEGGLNRTNDWETSVIVIVMQRLHEEDLTGVLLAKEFGFVHLMIPMEFEPARACTTPLQVVQPDGTKKDWTDPRSYDGELMDPVRMPPKAIAVTKLSGDYMYAGQYQQRPAPREGGMFKVDKIEIVDSCPAGGNTVAGWDFVASKGKKSPYTVRALMTKVGGDIYIRHVDRRRTNPTELIAMIEEVCADDHSANSAVLISMPQDPGQAGKSQKWQIAEKLMGYDYRITPETGDKEMRARPFAAHVGAGRVYLVKGAWNGDYIEELRNFPAGSYKDQVDASSRCFMELLSFTDAPINAAPELIDPTEDETVLDYEGDGWGG